MVLASRSATAAPRGLISARIIVPPVGAEGCDAARGSAGRSRAPAPGRTVTLLAESSSLTPRTEVGRGTARSALVGRAVLGRASVISPRPMRSVISEAMRLRCPC